MFIVDVFTDFFLYFKQTTIALWHFNELRQTNRVKAEMFHQWSLFSTQHRNFRLPITCFSYKNWVTNHINKERIFLVSVKTQSLRSIMVLFAFYYCFEWKQRNYNHNTTFQNNSHNFLRMLLLYPICLSC